MAVLGGIIFAVAWLAAAALWAAMAGVGGVMANDSGSVSPEQHASLLFTMMAGIAVAAFAGIPGGCAFFWTEMRRPLIVAFAALAIGGVGLQVYAYMHFSAAWERGRK